MRPSDDSGELVNRLAFGSFPIEAISFVMRRRILGEIKRLAETSSMSGV